MILGLDHAALAVPDIQQALADLKIEKTELRDFAGHVGQYLGCDGAPVDLDVVHGVLSEPGSGKPRI